MADVATPRIVGILAAVGLALAANRWAPGILQAVIVLVVLYVVLTNVPRVTALIRTVPNTLRAGYAPGARSGATGGAGRLLHR